MKSLFAAVVLVGIILTSTASATTILGTADIKNHNNNFSDKGNLWGGGLTGGLYYTGIYSWTNNVGGGTDWGKLVPDWGFCIELTQGARNGVVDVIYLEEAPLPAQYGTPMGTDANFIRELWGRFFDPCCTPNPTNKTEREMDEAFGAAVWEIIYETDPIWDVTTGAGFHASNIEQAAIANEWLGALNGDEDYFDWNLVAISRPGAGGQDYYGQDYLVRLPTTPPPPNVPEPATIALLGLGALSLIRRKRRM